jgi:hypothetical protein
MKGLFKHPLRERGKRPCWPIPKRCGYRRLPAYAESEAGILSGSASSPSLSIRKRGQIAPLLQVSKSVYSVPAGEDFVNIPV